MRENRGQTIIDFAVGASVFLLAVLLVFTFSSSLFTPFQGSQEDVIVKTRVATELTHSTLTSPQDSEPYVINEECAAVIFANSNSNTAPRPFGGCEFANGAEFSDAVPVATQGENIKNLNITIENDAGPIYLDRAKDGDDNANMNDVYASYGPAPPEDRNTVVVAERNVYIDGKTRKLEVRIWE